MITFKEMKAVNRSFGIVRDELADLGLLYDGVYLDVIDLEVAMLPDIPIIHEGRGYVIEEGSLLSELLGWREGVIYLSADKETQFSMVDVIRHEFAHAWHWLDNAYFDDGWFVDTFGAQYDDCKKLDHDYNEHVTEYAATNVCEDFAETFMTFVRCRKDLTKFKHRKGLYRKLKAVEKAVKIKSDSLKRIKNYG